MGPAYRTRAGVLCKWSVTLPICRTTGLPTISSGWTTLLFVQLDNTSELPRWLPNTHIRYALK